MYADLFDQLGRSRNAAANATVETPPIVAFKAGVMTLTGNNNGDDKYTCTADPATRGQVRLIRNPNNTDEIKWQLYDRRRDTVVETDIIPPGTTFTKVEQSPRTTSAGGGGSAGNNNKDRIYVWTRPASTPIYKMYWLQDADDTDDDDICKTVNETLKSAKAVSINTAMGGRSSGSRSTGGTVGGTGATNADPQVDTLSSILENLGMPAPSAAAVGPIPGGALGGSAAAATTTTTNQLTLADLQGAMASIQQQQVERQAQQVDLTDIITTEAITDLIEHDPAAVQRLMPFLPETQQSMEHLRDNLLSPSVRRSLALLSQALADGGESYGSVIANFQLDAQAGQDALVQGNPIAAFLDCITASVAAEATTAAGDAVKEDAASPDQAKEEDEEMKEEESKEDAADQEES
jgi:hypothetical protein